MALLELNMRPVGQREVERATSSLDKMKKSAGGTERALGTYVDASGRVRAENGRFVSAQDQVTQSLGRSSTVLQSWSRGAVIAIAAATAAATGFAAKGVADYRSYNQALAEVGTLVGRSADDLGDLDAAARSFAENFGGSATQQVQAFYQAISAGVGDVSDATGFLETANTLAIAGVTDITTSVDLLTTVTNAYASSGLTAARASDVLFTGVRVGKTTVAELSSALGQVVPIASSVGVSLDEVTAGVAALTSQGQSTSLAVTGIRAALAALIKPSDEAQKLAASLGIEFNTAALQARGFGGVIEDVKEATGNNQQALATLFGSVEALNAVLALTGDAGDVYSDALSEISAASGAAQAAADSVGDSLQNRLNQQLAILSNAGLQAGESLLTVLVPALELVTSSGPAVEAVLKSVGVAAIGLAASQIPALATSAASLVVQFTAATSATGLLSGALTVLRGAVVALGGPLGLIFGLLGGAAAYFLVFRDNANKAETASYDAADGTAKLNEALGVFYTTAAPSAGKAAIDLANDNIKLADSAYEAAQAELEKRRATLESFAAIEAQRQAGAQEDPESALLFGAADEANQRYQLALEELTKREKQLKEAIEQRNSAARSVTGSTFSPVSVDAPSVDTSGVSSDIQKILDSLGASSGGGRNSAAGGVEKLKDAYESLISSLDPASKAQIEFNESLDTLNAALDAGVINSDQYAVALELLRQKFDEAKGASDTLEQATDTINQSFSDLFLSIGEGSDAAKSALAGLLDQLSKLLLQSANTGLFGEGGIGGALLGLLGFEKGGVFSQGNVVPFASGTVINQPTFFPLRGNKTGLMGEAGPEAIMPLSRGPDGKLGVMAQGGGGGIAVNNYFNTDARGAQLGAAEEFDRMFKARTAEIGRISVAAVSQAQKDGFLR